jgi:DNA-directed RNA polymerase subunit RPC12/RpoP
MSKEIILNSIITCPECGFSKEEVMPLFAHQYFYKCSNCGKTLKPKAESCCIFCSYGNVKCPTKQRIDRL